MRHPKDIGDLSTLAVMHALQLTGHGIYLPFGENSRCDLIAEKGSRLARVQCKTGRLRNGGVRFNPCSSYAHHPNPKVLTRDYEGEIDEFGVFCPELGSVYLIPIEDVAARKRATLRVTAPRNNQYANVRLAAQYELVRFDVI